MSRTNVRKHPQKSTVDSATKARTSTPGPDCNAAVVSAKPEDPGLPAASARTSATAGQRPSPSCPITQSIRPRVVSAYAPYSYTPITLTATSYTVQPSLQLKIPDLIRDSKPLVHDLKPMSSNLPPRLAALRLQDSMAPRPTRSLRSGGRPQVSLLDGLECHQGLLSPQKIEICRNFQAGRCRNPRCPRIHTTEEDANNSLGQNPGNLPAQNRTETASQTTSSGQSTVNRPSVRFIAC